MRVICGNWPMLLSVRNHENIRITRSSNSEARYPSMKGPKKLGIIRSPETERERVSFHCHEILLLLWAFDVGGALEGMRPQARVFNASHIAPSVSQYRGLVVKYFKPYLLSFHDIESRGKSATALTKTYVSVSECEPVVDLTRVSGLMGNKEYWATGQAPWRTQDPGMGAKDHDVKL